MHQQQATSLTPRGVQCCLEGDKSSLVHTAKCLVRLQAAVGLIPVIKGKGNAARAVADLLQRLAAEGVGGGAPILDIERESGIDELVILDREVDMVTPMMSQLTYEGLLDDTFGVANGIVELPAGLISGGGGAGAGDKRVKVQFNSGDNLFSQLRDVNFEHVGPIVKAR